MAAEAIDLPTGEALSSPVGPATSSLVSIENITKTFGATKALRGVSMTVNASETVGLLGANGAGKSTLIKALAGLHAPTSGRIMVEGIERKFNFPDDARAAGIATVHQNIDDGVVFGMTVAENLMLDELATSSAPFFLRKRDILARAREVQQRLDLDLPLTSPVEDLPPSRRQEVAIAREIAKNPKLLILDEPTSTLSEREAERLFEAIGDLQRRGISILYISHRMSEVQHLCDRAVVLRDGRIVSEHEKPLDTREIASSILGELVLTTKHKVRSPGEVALDVRDMRAQPDTPAISFEVKRGEILGLTGLIGAGKTELLEQLCGHREIVSGGFSLNGQDCRPRDVADALAQGIVMIPEQRALQSIFPTESLSKHCTIGLMDQFSSKGFMRRAREVAFTRNVIDQFKVVAPGPAAPIEALSGGNQQKLLVGRWLRRAWNLLVLDEPMRGIDIGARGLISQALRAYSENVPVILCSSDPEEVIEVADRTLIMVEGAIVHEGLAADLTAEALAEIMGRSTDMERGTP